MSGAAASKRVPVVGDEYRDKRADNVRTLRVLEDLGDGDFMCVVIAQTYRGETTYPNRKTKTSLKHLTSSVFVRVVNDEEAMA